MTPEQVLALLAVIADGRLVMDAQQRRIVQLEARLTELEGDSAGITTET